MHSERGTGWGKLQLGQGAPREMHSDCRRGNAMELERGDRKCTQAGLRNKDMQWTWGAAMGNSPRLGCWVGKRSGAEVQRWETRRGGGTCRRIGRCSEGKGSRARVQGGEKQSGDKGRGAGRRDRAAAGTHRGPGRSRGRGRARASGAAWLRPAQPDAPPPPHAHWRSRGTAPSYWLRKPSFCRETGAGRLLGPCGPEGRWRSRSLSPWCPHTGPVR